MKRSMFNKKWVFPRKCMDFVQRKGFYIILFLCVLMIAGTGIYVTRMNMNFYSEETMVDKSAMHETQIDEGYKHETPKEEMPIDQTSEDEIVDKDIDMQETSEVFPVDKVTSPDSETEETQEPVVIVKQPVAQKTPSTVAKQTAPLKEKEQPPKVDKLMFPVQGEIILPFAMDRLVYFKTLEQWSTHAGINIRSERGTPVKAAAGGVVEKVYHDDRLGISILLDHGNGLKTLYANLSTDDMVKKEQSVKEGQVISGVGNTALIKSADESHLHFEVIKDGKHIDPKTMLH